MERKVSDNNNREEELEEQNLQLKEMTKLMSVQVEKIERDLESKLVRKDAKIDELEQRLEEKNFSKPSKRQSQYYNKDLLDQDLEELAVMESEIMQSTSNK